MTMSQQMTDRSGGYTGYQDLDDSDAQDSWLGEGINVGGTERAVSVAAGAALALLGLSRGSGLGLLTAAAGSALVYRGMKGHCPAYSAMGVDTAHGTEEHYQQQARRTEQRVAKRGIHVEEAFLINKPQQELYDFWRNFENLPRIMTHLESVQVLEDGRSRWRAKAPRIAGGSVEWEAKTTRDEPGQVIAWRSLPGSDIDTTGEIRFQKALGDRGTDVHVFMRYIPPAGRIGHWMATLVGQDPERLIRDDLRNFKRIMEAGEVITTEGQPHGACTGRRRRK